MIDVFSNSLGKEELDAVAEAFSSRWVGNGRQCSVFEREFASHLNVNEVLLTNNCTAAIYIGLKAIGVSKGDEVIVSTINFVACAGAILDTGAVPVFADVDPISLDILPSEIVRLSTCRTKAVVLLHYGGHPAPFDEIKAVCRPGCAIFEDSANAVSSVYKGRSCGTLADAGAFSFDAMKILVMCDGGALYIKDVDALKRARSLRYLGLSPKTTSGMDSMKEKSRRWWEYDLCTTSGRYVSNDVMATIGRVQLRKLGGFIERRRQIWTYYQRELGQVGGIMCPPEPRAGCSSSYYLYWIRVPSRRDELAEFLAANGVYSTFRYFPLHMVRYFGSQARLPNAERVNECTLNIPLHQNLGDSDVERICGLIRKCLG